MLKNVYGRFNRASVLIVFVEHNTHLTLEESTAVITNVTFGNNLRETYSFRQPLMSSVIHERRLRIVESSKKGSDMRYGHSTIQRDNVYGQPNKSRVAGRAQMIIDYLPYFKEGASSSYPFCGFHSQVLWTSC